MSVMSKVLSVSKDALQKAADETAATYLNRATTVDDIIRGTRNGFVCGAKVRFPFAVAMTFMYSNKPFLAKLLHIAKKCFHHGAYLAIMGFIYQICLFIIHRLYPKSVGSAYAIMISSGIGGFYAGRWGHQLLGWKARSIWYQINVDVFSHGVSILLRFLYKWAQSQGQESLWKKMPDFTKGGWSFDWYVFVLYAIVMPTVHFHPKMINKGMSDALGYIYTDTNRFDGSMSSISDVINFIKAPPMTIVMQQRAAKKALKMAAKAAVTTGKVAVDVAQCAAKS